MPKTAMNEHDGHVLRKDNVWLPGKVAPVKPETIPEGMKSPSDEDLDWRVFTVDPLHSASRIFVGIEGSI